MITKWVVMDNEDGWQPSVCLLMERTFVCLWFRVHYAKVVVKDVREMSSNDGSYDVQAPC